jgi:RNA polymerase sigma-70 factor (ECF subfamily)
LQEQNKHIDKLLQACKNQDPTAQFEIYKRYYKAMFNTALRIVKDSFEAEDVMQEAFLNAFTKLDSYKGEVAFGAWLKRIVINKSLTQIKKNNRFEEVKFDVLENKLESGGSVAGDEIIDYSVIKANEILKTMEQLKDNYRVALTLSLIEGYDNEEIALIMNISNENCRTTISRAKNKLRRLLQQEALVN